MGRRGRRGGADPGPDRPHRHADDHARDGDLVGDLHQVVVDEGRGHQQRQEDRVVGGRDQLNRRDDPPMAPRGGHHIDEVRTQEQQAHQGLDQRVSGRDPRAAPAALAPEGQPAHDRDVVLRRDRRPATRAPRARPDRRSSARESGRCRRSGSSPTTVPIRKNPRPSATNIGQVGEHEATPDRSYRADHPIATVRSRPFKASSVGGWPRPPRRGSLPSVGMTASASPA